MRRLGLEYSEQTGLEAWGEMVRKLEQADRPDAGPSAREPVPLPDDYVPLWPIPWADAYRYLLERGFTEADVHDYQIGMGTARWDYRRKTGYFGRVIIPDGPPGELPEYWVGRAYLDGLKPKYRNPLVAKRDRVFNLWRALGLPQIVVCEGPLSALAAGRDAVATYGKDCTSGQLKRLLAAGKPLIIAYDGDATKDAIDLCYRCWAQDADVYYLPMPVDEDPADMGRARFRHLLGQRAVRYDPWTSARLLLGGQTP
jgi:hypothetical protein